jgi:hypothetical protein
VGDGVAVGATGLGLLGMLGGGALGHHMSSENKYNAQPDKALTDSISVSGSLNTPWQMYQSGSLGKLTSSVKNPVALLQSALEYTGKNIADTLGGPNKLQGLGVGAATGLGGGSLLGLLGGGLGGSYLGYRVGGGGKQPEIDRFEIEKKKEKKASIESPEERRRRYLARAIYMPALGLTGGATGGFLGGLLGTSVGGTLGSLGGAGTEFLFPKSISNIPDDVEHSRIDELNQARVKGLVTGGTLGALGGLTAGGTMGLVSGLGSGYDATRNPKEKVKKAEDNKRKPLEEPTGKKYLRYAGRTGAMAGLGLAGDIGGRTIGGVGGMLAGRALGSGFGALHGLIDPDSNTTTGNRFDGAAEGAEYFGGHGARGGVIAGSLLGRLGGIGGGLYAGYKLTERSPKYRDKSVDTKEKVTEKKSSAIRSSVIRAINQYA